MGGFLGLLTWLGTMDRALIGHTGFVGSNLMNQVDFSSHYNSENIDDIRGERIDTLYCAGTPGVKWYANQNPKQDLSSVESLIDSLNNTRFKKLVLISTIGVYDNLDSVDEGYDIEIDNLRPYGRHRRMLELHALKKFDSLVVRLPSIFGKGLKKNFIYDAIRGGYGYAPNKLSYMQFYNLDNLSKDIEIALSNGLRILNISSSPIKIGDLTREVFSKDPEELPAANLVHYNMKTKHSKYWDLQSDYLYSEQEIVEDLSNFVKTERERGNLT